MTFKAAAIIPAAGSGSRMQAAVPKQFLELGGTPVLRRTVEIFSRCPFIAQIVVAAPADRISLAETLLEPLQLGRDRLTIVAGGERRQDSVLAGLQTLKPEIEVVLVHDAARPLVSPELIRRCCESALAEGAAIAAIPVRDTLKKAADDGCIAGTIDRDQVWQAQTPQAARTELLLAAYAENGEAEATDESSLLEAAGIPVRLVPGETTNFKLTGPEDFDQAARLLPEACPLLRIGHGYDAHRFAADRKLILGGEQIDHPLGLAGHSDADVVTHALCDAILGALGQGDIGTHFPDSDPAYRGIDSLELLGQVMARAAQQRLRVVNADLTVVCQAPRLAPYLAAMRRRLAACCDSDPNQINIKATTTEKMGFTGRQEGIGCHAVVLLSGPN